MEPIIKIISIDYFLGVVLKSMSKNEAYLKNKYINLTGKINILVSGVIESNSFILQKFYSANPMSVLNFLKILCHRVVLVHHTIIF